ncbi:MAG: ATP-binding protein [Cyclobacteriaceae bacterium]|nr:MAG: ATP-binding protein [Cyclobacteriaceae bacterium]
MKDCWSGDQQKQKGHDVIGEQTVTDAVLDRIVHNAHRVELKGESLRKKWREVRGCKSHYNIICLKILCNILYIYTEITL